MARIVTRCPRCQADSTHLRTRGGWQVRITVLPDEKHYATSPCAQCGEWHFRALDIDEIRMMRDRCGVLVEDLSLINPGLERDTMPDPTAVPQELKLQRFREVRDRIAARLPELDGEFRITADA